MMGEHSSKKYDEELESIRSKVLLMGGIVETQFLDAMTCFRIGNLERAERVMREDDTVNQLEVQLDDQCSHLIVKRQPTANDLRTVMATLKVITDLERIGDEAAKIARIAKALHARGAVTLNHYEMVRTIATATSDMINGGRTSFVGVPMVEAPLEGGVNIVVDGHTIGAVGVSGVKSSEDAQIAKAGIAALA